MMDDISVILFVGILVVLLLSLYPFNLLNGFRSFGIYLSPVAIFLFCLHEAVIGVVLPSESVPIRADLLALYPAVGFILFGGLVRICIILANMKTAATLSTKERVSHNRCLQLGILVPCFVGMVMVVSYFVFI